MLKLICSSAVQKGDRGGAYIGYTTVEDGKLRVEFFTKANVNGTYFYNPGFIEKMNLKLGEPTLKATMPEGTVITSVGTHHWVVKEGGLVSITRQQAIELAGEVARPEADSGDIPF